MIINIMIVTYIKQVYQDMIYFNHLKRIILKKNAYYIFEYYQKRNISNAYYIINCKSDLYKNLVRQNKTQNLIPVYSSQFIYNAIYSYILNSKIIINSYIIHEIQKVVSQVNYLKYLFITHAIGYFKLK